MANELIINASLPETRIALMEDGEIQELLIERASGKGIVGNIYKGRVTRVLPGMQAAFVDIGLEKAAFLYVDDVYVHSELWEEEEGTSGPSSEVLAEVQGTEVQSAETQVIEVKPMDTESAVQSEQEVSDGVGAEVEIQKSEDEFEEDDEDEEDPGQPVEMGPGPDEQDGNGDSSQGSEQPQGTIAPEQSREQTHSSENEKSSDSESAGVEAQSESDDAGSENASEEDAQNQNANPGRRRHRRGRRGGRFRRKGSSPENQAVQAAPTTQENYPESYHEQVADVGQLDSDRAGMIEDQNVKVEAPVESGEGRPANEPRELVVERRNQNPPSDRSEFRSQRSRDRRIRQKASLRPARPQINIQDLLKEGQEVLVQVAKDPIATKGARLTCHISLPGRHLVCMPTIDHVGVSRRIEREDERRRLREYVERNRPRNLGFIVRTASGKQQSEKRIKQDIDYLTRLWNEIREKAASVTAPALVYEDLNSVLRAIRDWVTEEIDKVIVDSRYHYNEILKFVSHFMPPLKQKVELYHGDIPIFDAYSISTELSRALERKVWLKSGGYIVIDQAEALVAIDVNTGRYVGKKNLEDTILKTNLEAVQEIAYQLRLRNCGGIIILDLIDMEKDENKQRVYRALEDALSRDRARPTILKISELGLVEMTRKRTRDTIIRTLCESCTHCEGKGFIKSKQTVAYEVMREVEREGIEREVNKILVQAHPEVIDILAIDERETLDQMERRYRKQIYLQAVMDFHPEQFEVTADKRERSERGSERGRDYHHEKSQSEHYSDRNRNRERDRERDRDRERHRHSAQSTNASSNQQDSEGVRVPKVIINPVQEPISTSPVGLNSSEGNGEEKGNLTQIIVNPTSVPANSSLSTSSKSDEAFDEEDRLAFLRAQAAQDAALARLGNSAHAPRPSGDNSRGDRNNSGPGGRRNPRGRRGGKFRRGNDRSRDRNSKSFGYGPNVKKNEIREPAIVHQDANSGNDSDGKGSGGDVGGGGDHSQPPI